MQHVQASDGAFAAVRTDGGVATWGDAHLGGDSSTIQDSLVDVQQVQSTKGAFAAIRADGTVVTWGDAKRGGDSSMVQASLQNLGWILGVFLFSLYGFIRD